MIGYAVPGKRLNGMTASDGAQQLGNPEPDSGLDGREGQRIVERTGVLNG
jgi:hypothetical protein